ncbi:MAG TPA: hypothetical protein VL379_13355 [Pseudomonadales bacterium]|nr:hypothetical protein [Pseudomonadales bacterium]
MNMQNPTPVGRSGYVGTAESHSAARTGSGSVPGSHRLFVQNAGKEQISALFEKGVTVAIRGSEAAQRRNASSHPAVTIVSEFSNTMSDSDSAMPRFAVAVKPELCWLRCSAMRSSRRSASSRKTPATPGSSDASSMTIRR